MVLIKEFLILFKKYAVLINIFFVLSQNDIVFMRELSCFYHNNAVFEIKIINHDWLILFYIYVYKVKFLNKENRGAGDQWNQVQSSITASFSGKATCILALFIYFEIAL